MPSSLSECQRQKLDSNPWPWDYEASVLPLCYCPWPSWIKGFSWSYVHLLSTRARGSSWIQTFDLGVMRQVFYHCATVADQVLLKVDHYTIFALQVPKAEAGLKPLTLGLWGNCITTVLLSMTKFNKRFLLIIFPFTLYKWKRQQVDSNFWPRDDEMSLVPLC
jgi:hypothetical protein